MSSKSTQQISKEVRSEVRRGRRGKKLTPEEIAAGSKKVTMAMLEEDWRRSRNYEGHLKDPSHELASIELTPFRTGGKRANLRKASVAAEVDKPGDKDNGLLKEREEEFYNRLAGTQPADKAHAYVEATAKLVHRLVDRALPQLERIEPTVEIMKAHLQKLRNRAVFAVGEFLG